LESYSGPTSPNIGQTDLLVKYFLDPPVNLLHLVILTLTVNLSAKINLKNLSSILYSSKSQSCSGRKLSRILRCGAMKRSVRLMRPDETSQAAAS